MDRCPLCCGTFHKPKLLPCLDTMCFTCRDEYVLRRERIRDLPVPFVWLGTFGTGRRPLQIQR
ncbi:hypothetical protein DPMN_188719 [Dreissena polymorpha]|uniref:Zinc finger C3HC4 RING-type domain-containing protein n=1 Tax=Dreissena polymorpha TaxID=45954 RepID=A0A9D4IA70_DREPO|nr:hypothetical protein DPMN_188719 [Dreissena polymorpha]